MQINKFWLKYNSEGSSPIYYLKQTDKLKQLKPKNSVLKEEKLNDKIR